MQTYSLRAAADMTGQSLSSIRKRADRGTLRTVLVEGRRYVPESELERAGLLPGAEIRALQARIDELERELATHRQLAERAESSANAERQAREHAEAETHEHRAARLTAEQRLQNLEQQIADAGPIRAWRLSRQLRRESTAS